MMTDDSGVHARVRGATKARSQLFTVRLWREEVAGGCELRGQVRNVASGAGRGFRDWSDLVAFLTVQMQEDDSDQASITEGGI
jgi:hypothetical protein